jgi:hypothetical protein
LFKVPWLGVEKWVWVREGCSRIVYEVVGERLRTFSNRKGVKKYLATVKERKEMMVLTEDLTEDKVV